MGINQANLLLWHSGVWRPSHWLTLWIHATESVSSLWPWGAERYIRTDVNSPHCHPISCRDKIPFVYVTEGLCFYILYVKLKFLAADHCGEMAPSVSLHSTFPVLSFSRNPRANKWVRWQSYFCKLTSQSITVNVLADIFLLNNHINNNHARICFLILIVL